MKNRILYLFEKNPKLNLILIGILLLITIPGLFLIEKDFTYKIWHQQGDPLLKSFNQFQSKFGNDDDLIIGVTNENGLFNQETFQTIFDLSEKFWTYRDVAKVDSLLTWQFIDSKDDNLNIESLPEEITDINFQQAKQKFAKDDRALGRIISHDLKMTLITITAKTDIKRQLDYTTLSRQIEKDLSQVSIPGIKFTRVGSVTFTDMFEEISFQDLLTLFPLVVLIFCLILRLMFGNLWSVFFAFSIAALTIIATMGISGYFGQPFNLVSSATPTILLTVAMADAIHLMTLFFRAVDRGENQQLAFKYSMERNFGPTLLTSVTTSVGFLSFSNSKVYPVSILGIQVAIGVSLAWVISYLIFPYFIQYIPPKKHKLLNQSKLKISSTATVHFLIRNKLQILGLAIIASALGFYFTSQLRVNMNAREQFSADHKLNQNIDRITNFFGPNEKLELMIHAGEVDGMKDPKLLRKIEELERWFLSKNYVEKVTSPLNILRDLNYRFHSSQAEYKAIPEDKNLAAQLFFTYNLFTPAETNLFNMMSKDYQSMRFTLFWDKYSSSDVLKELKIIQQKMESMDINGEITGKTPIFHELAPYVVETFINSFIIAFLAITIVLMLVLKSVRLGLLSLVPNLFPLFVGGTLVYLLGLNFDIGIVMVGAVALGIAVDDSIHFLFNFKQSLDQHKNIDLALDETIHHTFPSLFFTTLILVIGFGSFSLAEYIPNALFGSMTAFILIIALIADFIILPACIAIFYTKQPNVKK